jgi:U3 small nucleolar RNA-associated protein 10
MYAVDEVEAHTIEALVAMVMKLSENTFKPLFVKLVSWYKADPSRLHPRQLAFVHVVDSLAGALKNIFGVS